ncbi:MAG: T9SS C-terminal target domain-containing protein, partial [Sphingobacteriales bacterium]
MYKITFYRFSFALAALFLMLAAGNTVSATHIRAGDIVARSLGNPLQFEFTLVIYTDAGSLPVQQEFATLFFGDGTSQTVNRDPATYFLITPETYHNEFKFTHQYNAPGYYTVSFNGQNRNEGILNMSQSGTTSFLIQTEVYINPLAGTNITPRMSVPPLDKAARGQIFEHNPGAYDIEGDCLTYLMIMPRMSLTCETCPPQPATVPNYTSPADPVHGGESTNGGAATFDINATTGLITWNTPGRVGEYNIAFVVEEWRLIERGKPRLKMSVTTRDMQILVEPSENKPPKITIPKDLCVIPGTLI